MKKWKILSSSWALDNPWFPVKKETVELENGEIIDDYFVWEEKNVSYVVAITPENKFLFCKQYKHGVLDITLEIPAGYIDEGEAPESAAQRELVEETGYTAPYFEFIGELANSPSKNRSRLFGFIAQHVKKSSDQDLDSTEKIEVVELSFEDIMNMIQSGEIYAAPTIAFLFLAFRKLNLL